MKLRRFALSCCTVLAVLPTAVLADMRDHPPAMQAIASFSGPVQAYQCLFEGISNDAVRENVKLRNRSTKQLTGVTIRYRWFDASGEKLFDNVTAVSAKLDSGERGEVGPPNGFGEPNDKVRRIVCSITQAQFADGSTWVAGAKYHGKLLPATITDDAAGSR